jgi:hypothetical protein
MGILEIVGKFLESPVTAIVVGLLLGAAALSGRLSLNIAHGLLVGAILACVVGIMRSGIKDWRLRVASVCLVLFFGCLFSYWMNPPEVTTDTSTSSIKPHPKGDTSAHPSTGAVQQVVPQQPPLLAKTKPTVPTGKEKPPTLLNLFSADLPQTDKLHDDGIGINEKDGTVLHIRRQAYLDFDAKAKFVGFYIPADNPMSSTETVNVCLLLNHDDAAQKTLNFFAQKAEFSSGYPDQMTNATDLIFSGRILIYHDAYLSYAEKADIIRAYAVNHQDVQFRGPDYLADRITEWYQKHGLPKPMQR